MKKFQMLAAAAAAAALALSLAACSVPTVEVVQPSAPASEQPVEPPQPTGPEVIEPEIDESLSPDMMTTILIQTYRDEFPDDTRSDEEVLAEYQGVCTNLTAALDSGSTFGDWFVVQAMEQADSERFGYILGGAMMAVCPEVVDHPNYD